VIVTQQSTITTQPPQIKDRLVTHESIEPMDHIPHPVSGQSQATHHQPHLRRRSRPATLRPQGRLPRRILRRGSTHSASPDLRGYLCSLAINGATRNSRATVAPSPFSPQSSPTLPQRPQPKPRPALAINNHLSLCVPWNFTGHWPLTTGHCLYEPTMNSLCGKRIPRESHTPAPSPSLLRIQPMVFPS
jgi:hypothetical protein